MGQLRREFNRDRDLGQIATGKCSIKIRFAFIANDRDVRSMLPRERFVWLSFECDYSGEAFAYPHDPRSP